MSVFYDPKKRKPQVWIYIFILLVPIVVMFLFYSLGDKASKEKRLQDALAEEVDVFDKF